MERVTLEGSVYVTVEPTTGAYIAMQSGEQPQLVTEIHRATLAPATPECLACLAALASKRLAGIPHELVRVDAL